MSSVAKNSYSSEVSLGFLISLRGETSGGIGGAAPPSNQKGDFVGQYYWLLVKSLKISFIFHSFIDAFAPAKHYTVYEK